MRMEGGLASWVLGRHLIAPSLNSMAVASLGWGSPLSAGTPEALWPPAPAPTPLPQQLHGLHFVPQPLYGAHSFYPPVVYPQSDYSSPFYPYPQPSLTPFSAYHSLGAPGLPLLEAVPQQRGTIPVPQTATLQDSTMDEFIKNMYLPRASPGTIRTSLLVLNLLIFLVTLTELIVCPIYPAIHGLGFGVNDTQTNSAHIFQLVIASIGMAFCLFHVYRSLYSTWNVSTMDTHQKMAYQKVCRERTACLTRGRAIVPPPEEHALPRGTVIVVCISLGTEGPNAK